MVSDINRYTTANSLMLPIFSKLSIASSQKKKSLKFSKIPHHYSFSQLVLVLIFAWQRFLTFLYFPFSFPFPFFLIKKKKTELHSTFISQIVLRMPLHWKVFISTPAHICHISPHTAFSF